MAVLFAVAIICAAQIAMQRSDNRWLLLVAGLVVTVAGMRNDGVQQFVSSVMAAIAELLRKLPGRTWAVAGLVALVVLAAAGVFAMDNLREQTCPQALELRILASPEGVQATREVVREYVRATARDNDGCAAVYPYVYAAGTSAVSGALARKWADAKNERPLEQLGPRPDIWLPDSMLDVRQVQEIVAKAVLPSPLERVTSIASSPIVLVGTDVTKTPDSDTDTLPRLVSALLNGREPALAAADPGSSTAGLLAADVYLRDAEGGIVEPDVARRRASIVFDSTSSATDEVSLMCTYLREQKVPTAALTSLRTWHRFVEGKALGAGCPAPITPPAGLPEPVVLESAPALDHPFVQFTWTGSQHRRAVERFRDWLLSESAEPVLHEAGLEEPHPACSDVERNACLPQEPKRTMTTYEQAKRPGRVLLAVDTSGSMAEATGQDRTTRFTVATRGVGEAVAQLGGSDELGLWSFPGAGGRASRELVGFATGSARHRAAVVDTLRKVRPVGTTPLHATIVAGMRDLAGGADGKRIQAMVVLTDGENTGSRPGLQQTVAQVRQLAGADVRLYVIATGEARCEAPGPLYQLTRAGRGECLRSGAEQMPETMARLFETLWSGR